MLFLDTQKLKEERQAGEAYPVRITDVLINGTRPQIRLSKNTDQILKVRLKASEKNITFHMSDFSYTSPEVMSYEYKLDGQDDAWQVLTGKSTVTYFNLRAGSYLFRVRRMGQPDSEATLAIAIASNFPPSAAWLVCLLAAVLSGAYYYHRKRKETIRASIPVTVDPVIPVSVPSSSSESMVEELQAPDPKYKTNKVSTEECKHLMNQLERLMNKEKPYKNPDLKIADLAVAIGTTAHALSYVFNQYLQRSYYDYVNDYRIAEFKRLVGMDEYARYTLSALAELCGFSSRASFFRYFKKATGITPNEYIRQIGK